MEDKFANSSSEFADEGTLAHSLGAQCLHTGDDPEEYMFHIQDQFNVVELQHDATEKEGI
jgi:hypothetical protein